VLDSAEGIASGNQQAFENLTYGLLLSGIAMQMIGNSRPASAAEHHISHCIEMAPEGLGVHSDALHGEKVGVGTLLVCKVYHSLLREGRIPIDYTPRSCDYIQAMFGNKLSDSIITENRKDAAAGITGQLLSQNAEGIAEIISRIPDYDSLLKLYQQLGVKSTLPEIEVPAQLESTLLEYSPLVRNRLTLMRLRSCF
jgi:glycerol-1-phosphate dehydrogenase [NAD(P)+]